MSHIEKSASIPCDAPTAWAFVSQRENAPKLVPNLVRVWDIAPAQAGPGQAWKFEFKLLGLSFEGTAKIIQFEAGRMLQFQTTGRVPSKWTYTIAPEAAGARATVAVDYDLPDNLWARVKDRVALSRIHESQIEEILVNLAAQLG